MNSRLAKLWVVLAGMIGTLLAFLLSVELLRVFPVGDVTALAQEYWRSVPEASGVLPWVLGELGFYAYLLVHCWLLWLVPALGGSLTWMMLQRLGNDDLQMYLEQIHNQDAMIARISASEELAAARWERTELGLDKLLQASGEMWLVLDEHHRLRRWNAAAQTFLKDMGIAVDGMEGRSLSELWPGLVNTHLYKGLSDVASGQTFNQVVDLTTPVTRSLLAWMWPLGEDVAMLLRDVSHLRQPESFRANAEAMVRQLVEESTRPLAILDTDGRYLDVSRKWQETLGLNPATSLKGISHMQVMPNFPHNFSYILQQLRQGQVVGKEDERLVVNGQEEAFSWHLRPWMDVSGRVGGYVFSLSNISELARLRAQVKDSGEREHALAYRDMLTGLPNRQLFNDRLNMSLAQAYRQLGKVALLFLDLDGFKAVNDKLGHDCGDLLLKQVAERLKGCIRQTDTVARLGGDEFTMILNIRDKNDAEMVAQKILQVIREPYDLAGKEGHVGTSIGIALYPQDATQAGDLIRMADNAMYAAKQAGKNTWRFHVVEPPKET